MSQAPLTRAEMQQAVDAVAHYGSIASAAVALGIKEPTFRSRVRVARQRLSGPAPPAPEPVGPMPIREPLNLPFEEAWANWMRAIGMAKDRYIPKLGGLLT